MNEMQEKILLNIDNPGQLEKLYRSNKPTFKSAFNDLYVQLRENPLAEGWYQRLNYAQEEMFWGTPAERTFVVGAALFAALIAKLPAILSLSDDFFYPRNMGFIVFPVLIAFFARKNKISATTGAGLVGIILASAIFINLLPKGDLRNPTDTVILSCIHLPVLLWSLLGFTFGGGKFKRNTNWLGFLRYNGEFAVMMVVLLIASGLTTALTINLFRIIGLDIQEFYFNNIVVCGLAAVPLAATFLTQTQPTIVGKVSPLIANLFAPIALVMLVVYLGAVVFSGKNPYQDREFLLLFNALLVGVMALIFFSAADAGKKNVAQKFVLFALSSVTILVNCIALSAVLFRISEWGFTPNRTAVLGANVLMLIHLFLVSRKLFGALNRKADLQEAGNSIVSFLPVYAAWAAIVTFLFPFIFEFK